MLLHGYHSGVPPIHVRYPIMGLSLDSDATDDSTRVATPQPSVMSTPMFIHGVLLASQAIFSGNHLFCIRMPQLLLSSVGFHALSKIGELVSGMPFRFVGYDSGMNLFHM